MSKHGLPNRQAKVERNIMDSRSCGCPDVIMECLQSGRLPCIQYGNLIRVHAGCTRNGSGNATHAGAILIYTHPTRFSR